MNRTNQFGRTPLHWASYYGHTAAAVALIERGAGVNEKDHFVENPLHHACQAGHTATAVALIERGAIGMRKVTTDGLLSTQHAALVILPHR